jgi:hypothetical protein
VAAGAEDGFAVFDIGSAWEEYVRSCGRDLACFKRDDIHANERGKQIFGRLMARHLSP